MLYLKSETKVKDTPPVLVDSIILPFVDPFFPTSSKRNLNVDRFCLCCLGSTPKVETYECVVDIASRRPARPVPRLEATLHKDDFPISHSLQ